jgi:amicyanin
VTKKHIPLLIIGFVLVTAAVIFGIGKFTNTPAEDISQESSTDASHDDSQAHEHSHDSGTEGETPAADLTSQTAVSIDISNYAFAKPNIKIKKGATVTWTNRDPVAHNVMNHHGDDSKAHDAPAAAEVKPDVFAGPMLAQGESYSFTFNEVGESPYHCAPHPYMEGTVTVVE